MRDRLDTIRMLSSKMVANSKTRCWEWTGPKQSKGYGQVFLPDGRRIMAHRLSYLAFVGTIPKGWVIDHLCRNTSCINPHHLEAVTPRENTLRGDGDTAKKARMTHCKNGHRLSGENLLIDRWSGHRRCRKCRMKQERARSLKRSRALTAIKAQAKSGVTSGPRQSRKGRLSIG